MSDEEIRTKLDLSYISFCSLSILHNSKFILIHFNGIVFENRFCRYNESSLYLYKGWLLSFSNDSDVSSFIIVRHNKQ